MARVRGLPLLEHNVAKPSTERSSTPAAFVSVRSLIYTIQTFSLAARSTATCPHCSRSVHQAGHGLEEKPLTDSGWRDHNIKRSMPRKISHNLLARPNKCAQPHWNG